MASKAVMEKYAKLAVASGVNVQPGRKADRPKEAACPE